MSGQKLDKKSYFGFDFVKVAVCSLTEIKTDARYGAQTAYDWDVVVNFLYPGCELARHSIYLVFVDDELKYAGQYSGIFRERWLLRRNALWSLDHSKQDLRIQEILKSENPSEVTIWLAVAPFLNAPDGEEWNISKALEQRIILELQSEWNRVGKKKPTRGMSLREIMGD